MKKIGLFYGTATVKTAKIAKKIQDAFAGEDVDIIPIEKAWQEDFAAYDNMIVGTSTWFDGELPSYWDELMPELATMKMKNKKIAIFGLGDQKRYPDNFADGIGILAETFEACGATLVGLTSPDGYSFNQSHALKNGHLLGLVIDIENQHDKTDKRVKDWVEQLKREFNWVKK